MRRRKRKGKACRGRDKSEAQITDKIQILFTVVGVVG